VDSDNLFVDRAVALHQAATHHMADDLVPDPFLHARLRSLRGMRRVEVYGLVLIRNIQFLQSFIRFLHNPAQIDKDHATVSILLVLGRDSIGPEWAS
jgi:hypothetical protein